MSGHSKWANIKHQKAKTDAQRGNVFTKISKEITVAARAGGGNPDGNFRLKLAIANARANNIPNDNIQRAIARGTGEGGAAAYEEFTYEGYGPGGIAVMLEIMTDNRNRTAGEIRYIFSRAGGSLGETGCVGWMFKKKGIAVVEKEDLKISEDELMGIVLEAGAEDMKSEGEQIEITCDPEAFEGLKNALDQNKIKTAVSEITLLPQSTIALTGKVAEQALRLVETLENHDDVQNVYANFDIDEADTEEE